MHVGLNVGFAEYCLYSYPLDELAKMRSVHCWLVKECDINIPEMRCIDSGNEVIQVLANSSIFEARESRENNAVTTWCRQVDIASARWEGKEMERKRSEMRGPGQCIRKSLWGKISSHRNFVELKIYEISGREKSRECGNGDPSHVQSTDALAPPKSVREGQLQFILRQKNKLF